MPGLRYGVGALNLQDYYMEANLYEPPHIEQREFGIIKKGGGMWRHHAFNDVNKLRSFLIRHQPLHVYYSAAKYKRPSAKPYFIEGIPTSVREAKGFIEADLIFDIDNDHLATPTIAEAAYHADKLYWILRNTFALKDLMMKFSGSRGYHVHVHDTCVQNLNGHERALIAEYFTEYKNVRGRKAYNKNYVGLDVPVTTDLSRLIRLPGSIHGKTGKECRIMNIDG